MYGHQLTDEQEAQVEAGKNLLEQLRKAKRADYTDGWSDGSDTLYNNTLRDTVVAIRHEDSAVVREVNDTMPSRMRIEGNPGLDVTQCVYALKEGTQ